jgi:hypothetical protein
MSLLSWLLPQKKPGRGAPESSGLSRLDATRPVAAGHAKDLAPASNAQAGNRKTERIARRELLYGVVRQAMMRSGVLSASYKFKVLSLDARGRQFMVMVDLAHEYGGDTNGLAEIEAMIAQSAKARHDIIVTAVYWRMNEHVAVGVPASRSLRGTPSQPAPLESHPAALDSIPPAGDSTPAALDSAPSPLVPLAAAQQRTPSRYEPIEADEVAAFKRALAAGVAKPAAVAAKEVAGAPGASARAFDGSGKHGPQSYTLLTGFEDTEMSDAEVRMPALSGTQYGELN